MPVRTPIRPHSWERLGAAPLADACLPGVPEQWWYWTGDLRTDDGTRLCFSLVFFARDRALSGQLAHVSITDVGRGTYEHRIEYIPGRPRRRHDGFDLRSISGAMRAVGGGGCDRLFCRTRSAALDVRAEAQGPLHAHYGGRWHPYSFGGHTAYYARQAMRADGRVRLGNRTRRVTGTAWFDRQYGDLLPLVRKGWRWFALDLDDGRRVMLKEVYGHPEEHFGSILEPDGAVTRLRAPDFHVRPQTEWTSRRTGLRYPLVWNVDLLGCALHVRPHVEHQEVPGFLGYPTYWEGSCDVSGDQTGRATVEIVAPQSHRLQHKLRAWGATARAVLFGA